MSSARFIEWPVKDGIQAVNLDLCASIKKCEDNHTVYFNHAKGQYQAYFAACEKDYYTFVRKLDAKLYGARNTSSSTPMVASRTDPRVFE